MGRIFQVAKHGVQEPTQVMKYKTGETFKRGAVLVDDTNGEVVECSADPTSIIGVAGQGAATGLGYDVANANLVSVYTGREQEVSVALADRATTFSGRAVNGGTDPVVPTQSHIGEQYGLVKTAGGDWVIDIAETTTKCVEIVDIVPAEGGAAGFFLFKFLEAVMARP